MSNERSPDKVCMGVWMPRTLYKRCQNFAKARGETMSEFVVLMLTKETLDIQLTPEQYEQIAKETERARRNLFNKRAKRKSSDRSPS